MMSPHLFSHFLSSPYLVFQQYNFRSELLALLPKLSQHVQSLISSSFPHFFITFCFFSLVIPLFSSSSLFSSSTMPGGLIPGSMYARMERQQPREHVFSFRRFGNKLKTLLPSCFKAAGDPGEDTRAVKVSLVARSAGWGRTVKSKSQSCSSSSPHFAALFATSFLVYLHVHRREENPGWVCCCR